MKNTLSMKYKNVKKPILAHIPKNYYQNIDPGKNRTSRSKNSFLQDPGQPIRGVRPPDVRRVGEGHRPLRLGLHHGAHCQGSI
jgi:hypothetical protein